MTGCAVGVKMSPGLAVDLVVPHEFFQCALVLVDLLGSRIFWHRGKRALQLLMQGDVFLDPIVHGRQRLRVLGRQRPDHTLGRRRVDRGCGCCWRRSRNGEVASTRGDRQATVTTRPTTRRVANIRCPPRVERAASWQDSQVGRPTVCAWSNHRSTRRTLAVAGRLAPWPRKRLCVTVELALFRIGDCHSCVSTRQRLCKLSAGFVVPALQLAALQSLVRLCRARVRTDRESWPLSAGLGVTTVRFATMTGWRPTTAPGHRSPPQPGQPPAQPCTCGHKLWAKSGSRSGPASTTGGASPFT